MKSIKNHKNRHNLKKNLKKDEGKTLNFIIKTNKY